MKKIKLYCIPHAGSSVLAYLKLKKYLHPNMELVLQELAGRGSRINESYYNTIEEAASDVYESIKNQIDDTCYAILGHSMGSLITFELCHKIQKEGHNLPMHVFFSGRGAPHIKPKMQIMHNLPEDEFINEILNMGGTPPELFSNTEMSRIFLPILRADYKLVETYAYREKDEKLNVDISILYSNEDKMIEGDVNEWSMYTDKRCHYNRFDGGHFFLFKNISAFMQVIHEKLSLSDK